MGANVGTAACVAAHSALYFRPDGVVHACCATGFAIGSVTGEDRQSLSEIWHGVTIQAQREALEQGRYDFGCQECETVEATGGRDAALAHHFDRFAPGSPHRYPKLLDLALSSRCNLQCVMCNGSLSSSIRTKREGLPALPGAFDDRFFEELDEFLPHLERLQFKGGEPFLARENRRIWDRLIALRLTPEIAVTTNGTIVNDNVEQYVRELRMHPIISVDGTTAATLESIRVGVDARRLWQNIDRFQALAEVAGNGMTLSFCLMRSNWHEVLPFLVEADRRELNCNVIFVNQPYQFDLLRLPSDALRVIQRELVGLPTNFRTAEPERVWRELLTRIGSQLEHPVDVVVRARELLPHPADDVLQAALRAELAARHGAAPLVLDAEDGIITAVEAPAWSAWLEPTAFVGRAMNGLGAYITDAVGDIVTNTLPSDDRRITMLSITVNTDAGTRTLLVRLLVDSAGGNRRAFVVEQGTDSPAARLR